MTVMKTKNTINVDVLTFGGFYSKAEEKQGDHLRFEE